MIKTVKQTEHLYYIHFNDKRIGSFEMDVDGYFYFWDESVVSGSWTAYSLRLIADELDKINKPYDDKVAEYFAGEKENK